MREYTLEEQATFTSKGKWGYKYLKSSVFKQYRILLLHKYSIIWSAFLSNGIDFVVALKTVIWFIVGMLFSLLSFVAIIFIVPFQMRIVKLNLEKEFECSDQFK
jgi:hypothetical protein